MNNSKSWNLFLKEIKKLVDKESFSVWFQFINPLHLNNDTLVLEVPNDFYKDWLKKNFNSVMENTIEKVYGKSLKIDFLINPDIYSSLENIKSKPIEKKPTILKKKEQNRLSLEKYTFDNFIVGPSNQFAHAACLSVAKKPARSYNPLFIYGGVGLGKTHLLKAIGNHIITKISDSKIAYMSSEAFINDLIKSIQHKQMTKFRNKYRNLDALLIDDIQFIAGKDRTQEEFFHTFNVLYESHKQIIISSDKFPKEMSGLEERLRSRFECGLITDIQPPDLETKVAILKQKAEENDFDLTSDVALLIAEKVKSNVRELEGCLARICAYVTLTGKKLSISLAKDILKDIFKESNKPIDIKLIQQNVADYFDITVHDIKSKKRERKLVVPRQIAMFFCRKLTNTSLPEIGKNFGGRDHTTVLHSNTKIRKILTKKTHCDIYNALVSISKNLNCELFEM